MPPLDTSRQICPRHLEGKCPLPVHHCVFSHDKNDAPLCNLWVEGACPGGNSCFKRHFYNEKDTKLDKSATTDVNRNSSTVFTSPLVVKVKTLTQSERREEVDLDSGKRRSWVEKRDLELVDITGQASPALTKVLRRVGAEKNQHSKNEKAIPPLDFGDEKETEKSEDGEILEVPSEDGEILEDKRDGESPLGSRLVPDFEDSSNGKNNDHERKDRYGREHRYREIRYGRKYSDRENSRRSRSRRGRRSRSRSRRGRRKSRSRSRRGRRRSRSRSRGGRRKSRSRSRRGRRKSRSRSPSTRRRMDRSPIRGESGSSRRMRSPIRESGNNRRLRSPVRRESGSSRRLRSPVRGESGSNRRMRSRSMRRKGSRSPSRQRKRSHWRPTSHRRRSTSHRRRSRTPRRRRSRTPRRRSRSSRSRSRTLRRIGEGRAHLDGKNISPKRSNLRL